MVNDKFHTPKPLNVAMLYSQSVNYNVVELSVYPFSTSEMYRALLLDDLSFLVRLFDRATKAL